MIARSVIMIRPAAFGYNVETAASNSFQQKTNLSDTKIHSAALKEFDALADKLTEHGIDVLLFNDTVNPVKPDAVFPNNWFSTHTDGTVILYPMLSPARRLERREDVIERLRTKFFIKQIIDLSPFEQQQKFLEGTGSVVFDHANKILYAALSPRTDLELLKVVAVELTYELFIFRTINNIYHTNVVMNVSDGLLVVCVDCISENKSALVKKINDSGYAKVFLNQNQLEHFAGNMLMLQNRKHEKFMVMSEAAFKSLCKTDIETIEQHATILHSPLPTIESISGGSARCMLAENFLPPLA